MAGTPYRMNSPIGARMIINGRDVDYFCGTSYHALHGDPRVIAAASKATRLYGIGPGTSANMPAYTEALAAITDFFDTEAASYFASGYMTTLVLLQGLKDSFDLIFMDAATHYSGRDAVAILGKPIITFRHLDPDDLADKLKQYLPPGQVPAVVTDGVFPVTGALAPLAEYAAVIGAYDGALLCVDDAHGVGVLGVHGRGSLEHLGVAGPGIYGAGTLSKAFGGFGGIIPGSRSLIDRITDTVKLMAGASPPPVPAAAAGAMGITILKEHPEMLTRLQENVKRLRDGLRGLGLAIEDTPVPIVNVRAATDLSRLSDRLAEQDIIVKRNGPLSYSDAPDVESLRVAVFSTHSPEQIDRLVSGLGALL